MKKRWGIFIILLLMVSIGPGNEWEGDVYV